MDDREEVAPTDPDRERYWAEICARMEPMTPEEINAVAVVLRRIDERRAQQSQR